MTQDVKDKQTNKPNMCIVLTLLDYNNYSLSLINQPHFILFCIDALNIYSLSD